MTNPYKIKTLDKTLKRQSTKTNKHPNALWITLLVIGILLVLIIPLYSLNAAINGLPGICFHFDGGDHGSCPMSYGPQAFSASMRIASVIFPYPYILGFILIIAAIGIKVSKSNHKML